MATLSTCAAREQPASERPFAAYLHLSHHTGEKSTSTVPSPDGLLVVDYGANGR